MKHISLLRRIFLQKLTGQLHVQFTGGEKESLCFHEGGFVAGETPMLPLLQRFLAQPVQRFAWDPDAIADLKYGRIAPWIALSDALRDLSLDTRVAVYQKVFSHLPPMLLKNCPVHRFDFADEATYLFLYQLSLGVPSFEVKMFFLGDLNQEELNKRARTVLLVFLLGYLRAAPKQEEQTKKVNVASRILSRFQAKRMR
ncbi:MAG: hypothetical protein Q9N67_08305 [Ghiorsea sp.]|nr:hypothetical protein [Ghiorsea sp.]